MRLSGKSALITGGTSGIGLATAKRFVEEGARVAVTGRNDAVFDQVRQTLGADALIVKADVRSSQEMEAVSQHIKGQWGALDILFANAGRVFPTPLGSIDQHHYDDIMDTNVKGVIYSMQAVLPILSEGSSVILNTSFLAQTGQHQLSLVAAAKAAVRSLARTWSYELLSRRIRVNAVAPGGIDTPLLKTLGLSDEQIQGFKTQFAASVPVGRMGQASEIADAVVYLASDESRYVLGFELVVDGGASQL